MKHQTGTVLSDLHLFAGRSEGQALFDSIRAKIEKADVLVLNGDTFDFRWSQFTDEEESITEAVKWLTSLLGELRGDQHLYFLQGNHDCLGNFTQRLNQLQKTEAKFTVEPEILTLGDKLFLHGDGANWRMNGEEFEAFRAKWSRDKPKGKVAAASYHAIDALGISKGFHRLYFPALTTIKRITYHLDQVMPGWRSKTAAVYFGHTHCPLSNIKLDGINFFNTGSGIRGMGFAPQSFKFTTTSF